ncbi:tyrosine-type recombinase/integrase [Muricoccus pecuniae]|uniref:Site-specific recombinase XerD n=1 Tax=Muricoccus pecuniae TaxID=693023 RepID=A0A840Y2K3_9PROT|nr:tyrosine-type recombinase/integrase [Roseomonas pecuniae]MBB5694376.1 site-specific recombinase XerD [Roseomonas pecuniae]
MRGWVRTVFVIGDQAVAEGVPAALLGTPFIIDETGEPNQWTNEYLLARRNGDWSPVAPIQGKYIILEGGSADRASVGFLLNRAYQLDVFRRWCAEENLAFSDVTGADLDKFGDYLESGPNPANGWRQGGDGLQLKSINQYLISAIDLLKFGVRRGFRKDLRLKMRKVRNPRGARGKTTLQPSVLRRVHPNEITAWYTEEQIGTFIETLETASMRLAARIYHGMGLRLREALDLKTTDFPALADFRRDPARRRIRVVGKGDKERWVEIDEKLLRTVHRYCEFDRRLLERKLNQKHDVLLLGIGEDGRASPLKPRLVQKAFVKARQKVGFAALSPHLLRHHYAAHFLLRAWKVGSKAAEGGFVSYERNVGQALLSADLMRLKQNLGHADLRTTFEYLNALSFLLGSDIPEAYETELDASEWGDRAA